MKQQRQNAILQLIRSHNVETQEELLSLLLAQGYKTTQATISRDIRELHLVKTAYEGGGNKYTPSDEIGTLNNSDSSYRQVLGNGILSMDFSENIIVIKTVSGMAMAVGAAIDNLEILGIMGCIAGDDTLFLCIKDKAQIEEIMEAIKNAA